MNLKGRCAGEMTADGIPQEDSERSARHHDPRLPQPRQGRWRSRISRCPAFFPRPPDKGPASRTPPKTGQRFSPHTFRGLPREQVRGDGPCPLNHGSGPHPERVGTPSCDHHPRETSVRGADPDHFPPTPAWADCPKEIPRCRSMRSPVPQQRRSHPDPRAGTEKCRPPASPLSASQRQNGALWGSGDFPWIGGKAESLPNHEKAARKFRWRNNHREITAPF